MAKLTEGEKKKLSNASVGLLGTGALALSGGAGAPATTGQIVPSGSILGQQGLRGMRGVGGANWTIPPKGLPSPGGPIVPTGQIVPSGSILGQQGSTARGAKSIAGVAYDVSPPGLQGSTPIARQGAVTKAASGLMKGGMLGALTMPNTMGNAEVPRHSQGLMDEFFSSLSKEGQANAQVQPAILGATPSPQTLGTAPVAQEPQEGGGFVQGLKDFGYNYLGPRLGETIGEKLGAQKYGTGISAEGELTGQPFNPNTLPGQTATLGATGLEALGVLGDSAKFTGGTVGEYLTGIDMIEGGPIQTPVPSLESLEGVAPTAPVVPSAGAMEGLSGEEGSAQREYYDYVRGGGQMTPEMLSQLQETAEGMNTTFDPATGYSREAFLAAQDPALRTVNDLVGFNPADKGQSLSDFMAYRDDPSQRTQMTMDAQGRLQRSPATPMGAPSAEGEQPVEQSEPKALTQGDYRNILRAQGVEGSAQIVLAQQMMEEDEQKRQAGALAQERAQQIINQGNQSNQPKDTESTSFQKKKAEWLEREELLREDNATDEEIAARRRAFLYGDKYDAYLYEDNGTKPQPETSTAGSGATPTVTDETSYNALKTGQKYIHNGKEYTKK